MRPRDCTSGDASSDFTSTAPSWVRIYLQSHTASRIRMLPRKHLGCWRPHVHLLYRIFARMDLSDSVSFYCWPCGLFLIFQYSKYCYKCIFMDKSSENFAFGPNAGALKAFDSDVTLDGLSGKSGKSSWGSCRALSLSTSRINALISFYVSKVSVFLLEGTTWSW